MIELKTKINVFLSFIRTKLSFVRTKLSRPSRIGAGFRRFPSHSVRSTCHSGPFRSGQPGSPVDGGDNAARCPLTAHRLNLVAHYSTDWGATAPQPPPDALRLPIF